jgi:hypothetical protein
MFLSAQCFVEKLVECVEEVCLAKAESSHQALHCARVSFDGSVAVVA